MSAIRRVAGTVFAVTAAAALLAGGVCALMWLYENPRHGGDVG